MKSQREPEGQGERKTERDRGRVRGRAGERERGGGVESARRKGIVDCIEGFQDRLTFCVW